MARHVRGGAGARDLSFSPRSAFSMTSSRASPEVLGAASKMRPQLHSSLAGTTPSPQAGIALEGVVIPVLVAAAPPCVP